jgi:hypothetical protein
MTTSTVKNLSGDYIINSTLVTVNGNLVVTGNTTSVQSTNTIIVDNIITLNGNVSAATSPTLNAGIEINRGSSANVQLRWNESYDKWQLTNNGSTFGNIATTGNIDLTGLTIYDTANSVTVYTGTVNSGKSGLFVDNSNGTQQELATKSAAISYSIIFG